MIMMLLPAAGAATCADFDADNSVGFTDFFLFSEHFNQPVNATNQQYDLSGNSLIDFDDFFIFSEGFGKECGAVAQEISTVEIVKERCRENLKAAYQLGRRG